MHYPQIKNLRLIKDFKQEYVANFLGMSQPEYSRLESGARAAKAQELQKLAHLYGIRVDQILQNDVNVELSTVSSKPFRRNDAVPRDIVDRLLENNDELLKSLLEHQTKSERIIDRLIGFLDRKSGSESLYKDFPLSGPVNE
ncbi:MAG: helix-turn-helix domain-containing protein [Flavobacteriales bacterium]|jgi:transcriptional regulator with XRE-family HTH domain